MKICGLHVFVVSRSRFDRLFTLESLGSLASKVTLVVPARQVSSYQSLVDTYRCSVLGCPSDGIALTRHFCGLQSTSSRFVMLDDDLKFYVRVSPTDWHLKYPRDLDINIIEMFLEISSRLKTYAHVSVSAREGNQRLAYPGVECTRPLRVLAYRKQNFLSVKHGRVEIMEDFDVTLQLLRRGYKNFVISKWAQGQIETQMQGGCADYRTKDLHERNVQEFARIHTPFVKLRDKHNKSGGDFGHRLEATIYWQKAFASSQQKTPVD